MNAKKICNKLDISKNFLILAIVGLMCGTILILSLVACIALGKLEIAGVKELMGIFGGVFLSPSMLILIKQLIPKFNGKKR